MSNKKVLVLGGNFAGLTAALSVKQELGNEVDVTVVSKSDRFQFNPSFTSSGRSELRSLAERPATNATKGPGAGPFEGFVRDGAQKVAVPKQV